MIRGVDYSAGHPHPAKLKQAGVEFVCRYLSTPGNPKNLTATESLELRAAGLKIVTVFETTANRALSGAAGGKVDARAAQAQLTALHAPFDAPVYFAVDFDATVRQQLSINAYLVGAASVLGIRRVGVYGGFYVVARALTAGVCNYAWQTVAWSGGLWDKRAHIQQRGGGTIDRVSVDYDYATVPNYGQWFATPSPLPPVPEPPAPPVVYPKDDSFWTWLRWRQGVGEFELYGPRNPHVRPNVPQRIPAAWWRALRVFVKNEPGT